MAPQPSPSPPATPLGVSKAALLKAIGLLVLFWSLASFLRAPGKGGDSPVAGLYNGMTGGKSSQQQQQQHTDRAAVLIENRPLPNLVPVMLHFHSVLGPAWPIIFYTTPETSQALNGSAAFARAVAEGAVQVRHLPPAVDFSSHRAVSLFLADAWLWADLAPYAKVLLFQADSVLCSGSGARVDDFLAYDLVGAPIDARYGVGYNGGLSLRSRALVLDLVARHSWANDSLVPDAPQPMKFEDQWLYTRMRELPARPDGSPGANLPDVQTAQAFAVETLWHDEPLGFHQPARWQQANMDKIMKYCPEVGMISGSSFF